MNLKPLISAIGVLVILISYRLGISVERGEYVQAGATAAFIVIGLIYVWAFIRFEDRL